MSRSLCAWSVLLVLAATGCFKETKVGRIFCATDDNCPGGYVCADSTKPGGCVKSAGALDGGPVDGGAVGVDVAGPMSVDGPAFLDGPTFDGLATLADGTRDVAVGGDSSPVDAKAIVDFAVADAYLVEVAVDAPSGGTDVPTEPERTDAAGKPNGESCQANSQCSSTFCVEGVCCDAVCEGQCQSCRSQGKTGTCTILAGLPPSGKPACAGTGVCAGTCTATSISCVYPGADTSCGNPSCTAGVASSARKCNGVGGCGTAATTPCGNYACDGSACRTTCGTVSDCASGSVCAGITCLACGSGQSVCGDKCVDLQTDANHCGSCNAAPCGSSRQCVSGACKLMDGQSCSSSSQCSSGVCSIFYYDGDGDGYPVSGNSLGYCGVTTSPNAAYILARADSRWDCCDNDADVNPGVTGYFIDAGNECHTWDWNCSGQGEKKEVQIAGPCWFDASTNACVSTTAPGVPTADCGGAYVSTNSCAITTPGNCTSLTSKNAPVACH